MLLNCFAVGMGGFIGSVARYLIGLIPVLGKGALPLQTLLVNVAGAVLIGFIIGYGEKHSNFSQQATLFWKTGICGGFTTFSTFALETAGLLTGERPMLSLAYICLSVVLCVAGVFAGRWLANFVG